MSTATVPASRWLAASLVLAAAITLGVSYTLPTVSFRTVASTVPEVYSIWGGIVSLWHDGNIVLAPIVFLFSMVLPVVKLALLAGVLASWRGGPPRGRAREVVERLRLLGKWSMLDVLIIALFVGSIRIGLATASSLPGIHVFAAAIALSMLAAAVLSRELERSARLHAAAPRAPARDARPARGPCRRWAQRLASTGAAASLALALAEPLLVVSQAVFFWNEVALVATARALTTEGERALGGLLLAAVVALPALRAGASLCAAWAPSSEGGAARHARLLAARLDEWAMLEVLALALAIVHVKLEQLATTSLSLGFWAVHLAGALGLLDAWLLRRGARLGADSGASA